MRKIGILFCSMVAVLMIASGAIAVPYPLQFDADAAGGIYVPETIWGWDLEAVAKQNIPVANGTTIFGNGTGALVDFVTHQQLGADNILSNGDTFYEAITVNVLNGLGAPPAYNPVRANAPGPGGYYNGFPPIVPSANLYIDLMLGGAIANYVQGGVGPTNATNPLRITDDSFVSIFGAGGASMYVDMNANKTFDGADIPVALFNLFAAGPFVLVPSVFNGAAATVDFAFQTMAINPAYFSNAPGYPDFLDAILNGFHFTLTQGGVAIIGQIGGLTAPEPDEILLAWQETGFDAKFDVIPEPATMLLLGSGLVGLAGFGKKRLFRKG